jgi:hypothetical protein
MTRSDILKQYNVDDRGVINSPGKFEGEPLYVPYFWDSFMNGMADSDHHGILGFDVTADDKKEFPELKRRRVVKLSEREGGFVVEVMA